MTINLKKLQSIGRRKLKLEGSIEWSQVPRTQSLLLSNQTLGKEYLSTRTAANGTTHVISYFDASSLEPVDIFHELCKAKLDELGFATIEGAALDSMRDCSKDDPKYIMDANSAVTIVQETLVNAILFSQFPEESRSQRERMILRFESSDALTTLHTQMGFWGTAGVSYYRAASIGATIPFPEELVSKAIERTPDRESIRKEYNATNSLLDELSKMKLNELITTTRRFTEQESTKILDVIMRLFSAKTGLSC